VQAVWTSEPLKQSAKPHDARALLVTSSFGAKLQGDEYTWFIELVEVWPPESYDRKRAARLTLSTL
jgi:hypothetical protein